MWHKRAINVWAGGDNLLLDSIRGTRLGIRLGAKRGSNLTARAMKNADSIRNYTIEFATDEIRIKYRGEIG